MIERTMQHNAPIAMTKICSGLKRAKNALYVSLISRYPRWVANVNSHCVCFLSIDNSLYLASSSSEYESGLLMIGGPITLYGRALHTMMLR